MTGRAWWAALAVVLAASGCGSGGSDDPARQVADRFEAALTAGRTT